jgi:mannose-6-phosphate isomerase-like protein (cupin superfamily)
MYHPVNLDNKFSLRRTGSRKVIAQMNDYQFKIVKISGDFIWHAHPETDEAFIVVEGVLRIDFRDGHVLVNPGKCTLCQKALNIKRLLKQR